ncbi:hypothetical protein V6M85_09310 [Sulfolobus tengchongensis]|uniref:Uncharacterized protein n=1 Tax=Sulfolobus tengchongensis TaxID=207809 RepID=A0AAX4KXR0_9CREN
MNKSSRMLGQSEYIGFIIAILIIIIILIPLFYILSNYSVPSVKNLNYNQVVVNQINGGSILLFFNSTPSKSSLIVIKGDQNYTLVGVFYANNGIWYNVTSLVNSTVVKVNKVVKLPAPLIYNFTLPARVWNYTLVVQLDAYNTTVFAEIYPNETAFA